ncbi:hypothetical protein ASG92_20575 [Arthrobacter sp. Soil736]|uniref:hypothetical protein n=1 Tax=Arthrobacter sp. Soil736 TaxID=1736395 RepID=UPI0006F24D5C|nr:hypothetical protein [Arthrobacter sp. Soil736]KRE61783.1 hypothetical protein ASG92_20575 [Arthrobacter sp. Soil736]
MESTEQAAAKILKGFERSNGTFNNHRLVDEDTIKSHGKLSGYDEQHAENVNRAISQLIAAVGSDIEHATIVNAPNSNPASRDYHFAVFSRGILGYVEFTSAGADPQILVQAVPRSSITEIEIRGAKDYRSDKGSPVFVAKYANGITLDIRERDDYGLNVPEPGPWVHELLDSLRKDLAAA